MNAIRTHFYDISQIFTKKPWTIFSILFLKTSYISLANSSLRLNCTIWESFQNFLKIAINMILPAKCNAMVHFGNEWQHYTSTVTINVMLNSKRFHAVWFISTKYRVRNFTFLWKEKWPCKCLHTDRNCYFKTIKNLLAIN